MSRPTCFVNIPVSPGQAAAAAATVRCRRWATKMSDPSLLRLRPYPGWLAQAGWLAGWLGGGGR